jgi:hypothetical protein
MRRPITGALAAVALVTAAALALWWGRSSSPVPEAARDDGRGELARQEQPGGWVARRWSPGRALTWSFSVDERSVVQLLRQGGAPERIEGELALRGQLQWVELGPEEGAQLVELRLAEVTVERLTLSGQALPVKAEALQGLSALARYDGEGALKALEVPANASPLFGNFMERMARQLQAPWPAAPSEGGWSREVTGGFGEARWEAQALGCEEARGCGAVMRREAREYASFSFFPAALAPDGRDGEASLQVRLTAQGQLQGVSMEEALRLTRGGAEVATTRYEAQWTLLGSHTVDAGARRAALAKLNFGAPGGAEAARQDALRKRVGGWEIAQVLADLKAHGEGGQMPDHARWLWRTVGLLQLRPETARALEALAASPETSGRARALVLELLGSAGTPEAQAAMREVLGAEAVREAPGYGALVQRFLLVEEPEEASLAFLEQVYANGEGPDVRYGAASALGAAVSRSARRDPAGARRRADRLRDDLRAAQDDQGRRALLGALANTRQPGYVEEIMAHSEAQSPEVRAAAANALESMPSEEAVAALLRVLRGERDPQVQVVAARSLAAHRLSAAQLQALAEIVGEGGLSVSALGHIVNACEAFLRNGLDRAGVAAVLQAVRARSQGDAALSDRVTTALQALGG